MIVKFLDLYKNEKKLVDVCSCHCHLIISCFIKIHNYLPFQCRLTQIVLQNKPLNGHSVVCNECVCMWWFSINAAVISGRHRPVASVVKWQCEQHG